VVVDLDAHRKHPQPALDLNQRRRAEIPSIDTYIAGLPVTR
jgi:hypothetical protein